MGVFSSSSHPAPSARLVQEQMAPETPKGLTYPVQLWPPFPKNRLPHPLKADWGTKLLKN